MEDLFTPINNPTTLGLTAKERRELSKKKEIKDSFAYATNYLHVPPPEQRKFELDREWISAQDAFRTAVTFPGRIMYSIQMGLNGIDQFFEQTFDWYRDLNIAAKNVESSYFSDYEPKPLINSPDLTDLVQGMLSPVTTQDYIEAEKIKKKVFDETKNIEEANSAFNHFIETRKEDFYNQLGDTYSWLDNRNKTYIMQIVDSALEFGGGQLFAGAAVTAAAPGVGTAAWATRLASTIAQSSMAAGYAKTVISGQASKDYYNQNVGDYVAKGKDLAELYIKANQLGAKTGDDLAAWYAFSTALFGSVASVTSPIFSGVFGGTIKNLANIANKTQVTRIAANLGGRALVEGVQEGIEGGVEGAIISAAKKELEGKYPGTLGDTSFQNILNEIGGDEFWDSAKEEALGGAILATLFGLPRARKRLVSEYDTQNDAIAGAYKDINDYITKFRNTQALKELLKNPDLSEIERKQTEELLKKSQQEQNEALDIAQRSKEYADQVTGINFNKQQKVNDIVTEYLNSKEVGKPYWVTNLNKLLFNLLANSTEQEINGIFDVLSNNSNEDKFKERVEKVRKKVIETFKKVKKDETTFEKVVEEEIDKSARTIVDAVTPKIVQEYLKDINLDSLSDENLVHFRNLLNSIKNKEEQEILIDIIVQDFNKNRETAEKILNDEEIKNQLIEKINNKIVEKGIPEDILDSFQKKTYSNNLEEEVDFNALDVNILKGILTILKNSKKAVDKTSKVGFIRMDLANLLNLNRDISLDRDTLRSTFSDKNGSINDDAINNLINFVEEVFKTKDPSAYEEYKKNQQALNTEPTSNNVQIDYDNLSFKEGITQEDIDAAKYELDYYEFSTAGLSYLKTKLAKIFKEDFKNIPIIINTDADKLRKKLNSWKDPNSKPDEPENEDANIEDAPETPQDEKNKNDANKQNQEKADAFTQETAEDASAASSGGGGDKPPTDPYSQEYEEERDRYLKEYFPFLEFDYELFISKYYKDVTGITLKDDPRYIAAKDKNKFLIDARLAAFEQAIYAYLDDALQSKSDENSEEVLAETQVLLKEIFAKLRLYNVNINVSNNNSTGYIHSIKTINLKLESYNTFNDVLNIVIHEGIHAILDHKFNPDNKLPLTAWEELDKDAIELKEKLIETLKDYKKNKKVKKIVDSIIGELDGDVKNKFKELIDAELTLEKLNEFAKTHSNNLVNKSENLKNFFYGLSPNMWEDTNLHMHELAANVYSSSLLRALALETIIEENPAIEVIKKLYKKLLKLLGFTHKAITAYDKITEVVFKFSNEEVNIDDPTYTKDYKELEKYLILQTIRQFKQGLWQSDVDIARRNIKGFVIDAINKLLYIENGVVEKLEGNLKKAVEQGQKIKDATLSELVESVVNAYMKVHYLDGVEPTKESEAERLLSLAKYKESIQAFSKLETSELRKLNQERNKINIFKFPKFNLITPAITVRAQDDLDDNKVPIVDAGLELVKDIIERKPEKELEKLTLYKDDNGLYLKYGDKNVVNLTTSPSKILMLPTNDSIINSFIWYLASKVEKNGVITFSDIREIESLIKKETDPKEKLAANEIYDNFENKIKNIINLNVDIIYSVVQDEEGGRQYEYIPHLTDTQERVKRVKPKKYYFGLLKGNDLQVYYVENDKHEFVEEIKDFNSDNKHSKDAGAHGVKRNQFDAFKEQTIYIFQSKPHQNSPFVSTFFTFKSNSNEEINLQDFVDYFKSEEGAELRTKFTFVNDRPISHSARFNIKANYLNLEWDISYEETYQQYQQNQQYQQTEEQTEQQTEEQPKQPKNDSGEGGLPTIPNIFDKDGNFDLGLGLRGSSPSPFIKPSSPPPSTEQSNDDLDDSENEQTEGSELIGSVPQSRIDEIYTKAFFEAIKYRVINEQNIEIVAKLTRKNATKETKDIAIKVVSDLKEIVITAMVEILGTSYNKYDESVLSEVRAEIGRKLQHQAGLFKDNLSLLSSTNPVNDDLDPLGKNIEEIDEVSENENGEITGGEMVDTRSVESITNSTMRDMLFHHLARIKTTKESPISEWGKSYLTLAEAGNVTAALLKKAVHNIILKNGELNNDTLYTELNKLRIILNTHITVNTVIPAKLRATKLVLENLVFLFQDFNTARNSIFGAIERIELNGTVSGNSIADSITASLRQVAFQLATTDSLVSSLEELSNQYKNGRIIGENSISKQISYNGAIYQLMYLKDIKKEDTEEYLGGLTKNLIKYSYENVDEQKIDKQKFCKNIAILISKIYPSGLGIVNYKYDDLGNISVSESQPYLRAALDSMLNSHPKYEEQKTYRTVYLSRLVNSSYSPFISDDAVANEDPNAIFSLIRAIIENDILVNPRNTKRVIYVENKSKPSGNTPSTQLSPKKLREYWNDLLKIDLKEENNEIRRISGNRNVFDYFRTVKVNSRNNPFEELEEISKVNLSNGKGFVYFPITTLADKAITPIFRLLNIDKDAAKLLLDKFKQESENLFNKSKEDKFAAIELATSTITSNIESAFFLKDVYDRDTEYINLVIRELTLAFNAFDLEQLGISFKDENTPSLALFISNLERASTEEDVNNLIADWAIIRKNIITNLKNLEDKYQFEYYTPKFEETDDVIDNIYRQLGHYIRTWFYYKNNSPITSFRNLSVSENGELDFTKSDIDVIKRGAGQYAAGLIMDSVALAQNFRLNKNDDSYNNNVIKDLIELAKENKHAVGIVTIPDKYVNVKFSTLDASLDTTEGTEVNYCDGGGYCTPKRYCLNLLMTGAPEYEVSKIYELLTTTDPKIYEELSAEVIQLGINFGVEKPVIHGPVLNNYWEETTYKQAYYKFAALPIPRILVEGKTDVFSRTYLSAIDKNLDYVLPVSCAKQDPIFIATPKEIELLDDYTLATEFVKPSSLKMQIAAHIKNDNRSTLKTQFMKLANALDSAYKVGVNIEESITNIQNIAFNALSKVVNNQSFEDILSEFVEMSDEAQFLLTNKIPVGLSPFNVNHFRRVLTKIAKALQAEVPGSWYKQVIPYGIDAGLVTSWFDEGAVKALRPSTIIEIDSRENLLDYINSREDVRQYGKITQEQLDYYLSNYTYEVDSKNYVTLPAQIILSGYNPDKMKNVANRQVLVKRVPISGEFQIAAAEVVGTTPGFYGAVAIVDPGFLASSGSDHDGDTIYTYELNKTRSKEKNAFVANSIKLFTHPKIVSSSNRELKSRIVDRVIKDKGLEVKQTKTYSTIFSHKANRDIYFKQNHGGKDGTAIFANACSFVNSCYHAYFSQPTPANGKNRMDPLNFKPNFYHEKIKFSNIFTLLDINSKPITEDSVKRFYDVVRALFNEFLNIAVDNAKDPKLFFLGIKDINDCNMFAALANLNWLTKEELENPDLSIEDLGVLQLSRIVDAFQSINTDLIILDEKIKEIRKNFSEDPYQKSLISAYNTFINIGYVDTKIYSKVKNNVERKLERYEDDFINHEFSSEDIRKISPGSKDPEKRVNAVEALAEVFKIKLLTEITEAKNKDEYVDKVLKPLIDHFTYFNILTRYINDLIGFTAIQKGANLSNYYPYLSEYIQYLSNASHNPSLPLLQTKVSTQAITNINTILEAYERSFGFKPKHFKLKIKRKIDTSVSNDLLLLNNAQTLYYYLKQTSSAEAVKAIDSIILSTDHERIILDLTKETVSSNFNLIERLRNKGLELKEEYEKTLQTNVSNNNLSIYAALEEFLQTIGSYFSVLEKKHKYYAVKPRTEIERTYLQLKDAIAVNEGVYETGSIINQKIKELKEIINNLGVIAVAAQATPLYFSLNYRTPQVNLLNIIQTAQTGSEPTTEKNIQEIVEENIEYKVENSQEEPSPVSEEDKDSYEKVLNKILKVLEKYSNTRGNEANKKKDFKKFSVAKGMIAVPEDHIIDGSSTATYYKKIRENGGTLETYMEETTDEKGEIIFKETGKIIWFTDNIDTLNKLNWYLPVVISVYGRSRVEEHRKALIEHIESVVSTSPENLVFITDTKEKAESPHNLVGEGVIWYYLYLKTDYIPIQIDQMTVWTLVRGSNEIKNENIYDPIVKTPGTLKDDWSQRVIRDIQSKLKSRKTSFSAPPKEKTPELTTGIINAKEALADFIRQQSSNLMNIFLEWQRSGAVNEEQVKGRNYLSNFLYFLNQEQALDNIDSLSILTENVSRLAEWLSGYIQMKEIDGELIPYWSEDFIGENPILDLNNKPLIATLGREFEQTSIRALDLVSKMLNEIFGRISDLENKPNKTEEDLKTLNSLIANKISLEGASLIFNNILVAKQKAGASIFERLAQMIKMVLVNQVPISKASWFVETLTANVSGALKRSSIIQMFARLEKEVIDAVSRDFNAFDDEFMSVIKPLFDKVPKEKQAKLIDLKGKRLIGQGTKEFYDEVNRQLTIFRTADEFSEQRRKALRALLEIADVTYNEIDLINYKNKEDALNSEKRVTYNPAMIVERVRNNPDTYFNPEFITFVPKQDYFDPALNEKYINTEFNEILKDPDLAELYNLYTTKMQELYYRKPKDLRMKYMTDKHLFIAKFPKSSIDYFKQKDRRSSVEALNNLFDETALSFAQSGVDDPTHGHKTVIDTRTSEGIYNSQQHFTVPHHGIYDIGIPEGGFIEDLSIVLYQLSVNDIFTKHKERAEPMFKYIYSAVGDFIELKGQYVTDKDRAIKVLRDDLKDRMDAFLYDTPMHEIQDVTGKKKYLSKRQKRYVKELKNLIDIELANLVSVNPDLYDTSIEGVTDYTTLDVATELIPFVTERLEVIGNTLSDQTIQMSLAERDRLLDERAILSVISSHAEKYTRTGKYMTPLTVGIAITNMFRKAMQVAYLAGNIRNIVLEPLEILQEMFIYADKNNNRTNLLRALNSALLLEVLPKERSKFNKKFGQLENTSGITSLFTNAKNLAKIRVGGVSGKIDAYSNYQAFFAGQRLADHIVRRTILMYALQETAVDEAGNPILDANGVPIRWLDAVNDNGEPQFGADFKGFQRTVMGMTPMVTSEGSKLLTARDKANYLFTLASTMRGFMVNYMLKRFKPRAYYDFLDKIKDQNNPQAYDMGRWRWLFTDVKDIADPSKDKFSVKAAATKSGLLVAATFLDFFGANIDKKNSWLTNQIKLTDFDVKMINANKRNLWVSAAYWAMYQLLMQAAIAVGLKDDDDEDDKNKSWTQQLLLLGANIFNRASTESWLGLDTHTLLAPRNVYQQAQLSTLIPFWDYSRDLGMFFWSAGKDVVRKVKGEEIPMTTKGALKGKQTETERMFDKVFFPGLLNSNKKALTTKPKETAIERQWENLMIDSELSEEKGKKKRKRKKVSRSLD